jgi:hypothetical protein
MRMSAEHEAYARWDEAPAFDLWVKRTLRERYGAVVQEPVPTDLLEMLGTDAPEH